jgi:hypothetical protein
MTFDFQAESRLGGIAYARWHCMRLAPNKIPDERLLSSLVPEDDAADDSADPRFALREEGVFSGNARGIYIGILAGALAYLVIGLVFSRQNASKHEALAPQKLVSVATDSLAASPNSAATPAPVVVQVSADMLHVSAIALGHPRLAVINNKSVGEGDTVTIHTPAPSFAVTLRVVKITDGHIELSDGIKVFIARLSPPQLSPPLR